MGEYGRMVARLMAAEPQGPAYAAQGEPLPPPEEQMEGQAPAAPEEPQAADMGIDLEREARQAISSGLLLCKSFGTGTPEQIDAERYKTVAEGVKALFEGLAKYAPPTPPLDPNVVQKDQTDASKAVLQDGQHSEQMAVQRELGHQREGRPSGQAKP